RGKRQQRQRRVTATLTLQNTWTLRPITESIRSEAFWLYSNMVCKLSQFSEDLRVWSESCPCHAWLRSPGPSSPRPAAAAGSGDNPAGSGGSADSAPAATAAERLHAVRQTLGLQQGVGDGSHYGPCPLAGQRAVELATGVIYHLLDDLHESYVREILEHNQCVDLAAIENTLADFTLGKSKIAQHLGLKLQCWTQLPWKLADPALHHRLPWKHLAPGSATREELLAFIEGTPMEQCPSLSDFVWGLRFMPTLSRGKFTGPYVSLRLRHSALRKIISVKEEHTKLLEYFEEVSRPDTLAKRLGFWNHSTWQALKSPGQRCTRRAKVRWACVVLYALDPESQYMKLTALQAKRQEAKARKKKIIRNSILREGGAQSDRFSLENVERIAMSDHLQHTMSLGRLYSVSASTKLPALDAAH
ncbi:unnamed protein product, partial [Effrenium voratum]